MIRTRNLKIWLTMCSFLLAAVGTATGATLYVPSPDYPTITDAINAANSGDEIEVAPGTYYEGINFLGKAIRLYSSDGPEATTIDGTGHYHVVQCVTGEGPDTKLEGFTITGGNANGTGSTSWGGGMYNDHSSPTLTDCTFSGNSANTDGGGMYNRNSSPTLTNCTFGSNSASYGAGMYNYESSPTLTNCTFSANEATNGGGGMVNYPRSSPTVIDCIFNGNIAHSATYGNGGGVWNGSSSNLTVTNCIFGGNEAGLDGGGMYNWVSTPTVTNCSFSQNTAADDGGAIYNTGSSPTIINCSFNGNTATGNRGGGIDNRYSSSPTVADCIFSQNRASISGGGMENSESSPTVTNCVFLANVAGNGGGMANDKSSPTVTDCNFTGNTATSFYGGGMHNYYSSPTVTNCTFADNTADTGGGMSNYPHSSPTVTNCTFSGNLAVNVGGGMYNEYNSNPTVTNCILWGNTAPTGPQIHGGSPIITYCDVEGGWLGTGNIDLDPLFEDPANGDYHLGGGSPCIDIGDNDAVPADITTDLDGNPRIVNDTVDMGAYEYQVILVQIDIKPGSYPNAININGNGIIPVAILGSTEFDVTQVVIGSLSFAGLEVRVKPNGVSQCSISDVSGPDGVTDGYDDLVCQFVDDPLQWSPGDGIGDLTGMFLLDGNKVAPFKGSDEITIVP